ncbi:MAG: hypothetical protein HZA20_09950 [Nitrospirae bacterium]|nr:hypothetical protein [Nitrospirota bacterium]
MNAKTFSAIAASVFLLAFQIPASFAADTSACHCFQNRTYDQARKASADEYILATGFNSLLSGHFGIMKRDIIMARMNGVDGDDMLVALYAARKGGRDYGVLLDKRNAGASWQTILVQAEMPPGLSKSVTVAEAAGIDTVARYFGVGASDVATFRKSGFSLKETALLFGLARKTGRPASEFAGMSRKARKSWGEIAHEIGVEPQAVGPMIEMLADQH